LTISLNSDFVLSMTTPGGNPVGETDGVCEGEIDCVADKDREGVCDGDWLEVCDWVVVCDAVVVKVGVGLGDAVAREEEDCVWLCVGACDGVSVLDCVGVAVTVRDCVDDGEPVPLGVPLWLPVRDWLCDGEPEVDAVNDEVPEIVPVCVAVIVTVAVPLWLGDCVDVAVDVWVSERDCDWLGDCVWEDEPETDWLGERVWLGEAVGLGVAVCDDEPEVVGDDVGVAVCDCDGDPVWDWELDDVLDGVWLGERVTVGEGVAHCVAEGVCDPDCDWDSVWDGDGLQPILFPLIKTPAYVESLEKVTPLSVEASAANGVAKPWAGTPLLPLVSITSYHASGTAELHTKRWKRDTSGSIINVGGSRTLEYSCPSWIAGMPTTETTSDARRAPLTSEPLVVV
jgi:hypothetical protein